MKICLPLLMCISLLAGCEGKFVTCTNYYDDGETVRSTVPCNSRTGIKEGIMRVYKKNGDLWKTIVYINNLEEDTTRFFYSRTSELLKSVPMKEGKRNGVAKEYFKSGKVKREQPFIDDLKEGFHRIYNEEGRLLEEVYYDKGLKEKLASYYYEEVDQLREKISYIQDSRNGAYEKYDEEGNLLLKGAYKNGYPVGEWTFQNTFRKLITKDIAEIAYAYKPDAKLLDDYFFDHL